MDGKKKALDHFFNTSGQKFMNQDGQDDFWAKCQCCGLPIRKSIAHPHHKLQASLGGKENLDNMLIIHGSCHAWIHEDHQRERFVSNIPANAENGGFVRWTPELKKSLDGWNARQFSKAMSGLRG